MIDIIQHLQKYVPKTGSGIMMPLLLGGDQLSVERGESAQKVPGDLRQSEILIEQDFKIWYEFEVLK